MNAKLLRSIMLLHDDTSASLAESLGISEQSVCNKINEKDTEFKQGEIKKICRRYNLTAQQTVDIFFS